MTDDLQDAAPAPPDPAPAIVGDVVFGGIDSPVAVCTLASRSLLPELAGRPEIAIAGRVFTENVGVERMVQNLAAWRSIRFLIVCGRETRHKVGQTILALHRNGLDEHARAIGSEAPEPVMPNLTAHQLRAYQEHVTVVDMIGVADVGAIVERARTLGRQSPVAPAPAGAETDPPVDDGTVERIVAARRPTSQWTYDPVGYFLVFVDQAGRKLRAEQYTQAHRLVRVIEGAGAEEICHSIEDLGQVTLLAHAAYLGRELAKAETALRLGLEYEQDRPLARPAARTVDTPTVDTPAGTA
jgi:tetrahydromethanopterin S-methyltransferase subunit A